MLGKRQAVPADDGGICGGGGGGGDRKEGLGETGRGEGAGGVKNAGCPF